MANLMVKTKANANTAINNLVVVSGLLLAALVSGCQSTPELAAKPNDPFYAPIVPDIPVTQVAANGSLFRPAHAQSLFSDVKARRVGDIITVVLRENTSASKSATNDSTRETDVTVNPISGLGARPVTIGGQAINLGLSSSNEFAGAAQANQSNSLIGNISVTVTQVLANKNLVVRGEKWLTLNNGNEYIRLTGIVRPADVSPANEIQSSKVANARISYSGTGTFASAQQRGVLSRFFSASWWPF
jgi:flagellar L-ring protein precursor FlgH